MQTDTLSYHGRDLRQQIRGAALDNERHVTLARVNKELRKANKVPRLTSDPVQELRPEVNWVWFWASRPQGEMKYVPAASTGYARQAQVTYLSVLHLNGASGNPSTTGK